ncbi:diaminopropionate ammonia-lyase [Sphingomonas sp. MAH-20]|uniref:Diaminopropionate ammonia-lyase n=1 Tax=Sphingomonas horti TaxID=2682842 RepID=A0A6I4J4I0_9SPHN|nr:MULTISPECIES: diaminopropionate ammonia-lyase [Sphingomonas]MBA2921066.1 diaminopropionate ammonia-lyase [Sphingomonas sp. CGMCC 1.13658]MVO78131.1 diaminopropionate ammonia-lyase [Sphingomonas horti]
MYVFDNPRTLIGEEYPDRLKTYLSLEKGRAAIRAIQSWPGYAPTPLVDLPHLAARAGVERLAYKNEGERFGLGSFKALGGAYALARLAEARERPQDLVVCCATDGNHGRSVAWKASGIGCRCLVYLHREVSTERERAIAAFGAEIRRVNGNYDDAVRAAAADAAQSGWIVVSDTSYPGYSDIPCEVMQGYSVMIHEVRHAQYRPSHVFVQGGVGGLAAAVCADLWESFGTSRPRLIVVEPEGAACLFASARAGRPVRIERQPQTVMAGLACGEVSLVAWDILSLGAAHFSTIHDESAISMMRELASGDGGALPIVAGESATAGLAAFLKCASDPVLRRQVGIDCTSHILCFGTEADTDPDLYTQLVGRSGAEVRAGRRLGHVVVANEP